MRCRRCGLLRTWPAPDDETLRRFYDTPRYHAERTVGAREAWAGRAHEILAALPQVPAAALDFGAGEGHLVRALRSAGVHAEGVEPAPAARATAVREQGVELLAGIGDGEGREFELVTMLHSLEHVQDPAATLRRLRALLAPGAWLFIEVPHAGSFDMLIPSVRDAILDLPAHLHHFTPQTLAPILERAGFSVDDVQLFNALPVELAMERRRRRRGSPPPALPEGPAAPAPAAAHAAARPIDRVVARLRQAAPGSKFRVLAHVRSGG